jgi:ubiquinone/menaquinone biosynthesis C-methylase UbiE
MPHHSYLMESDEEVLRLELKTDSARVARQASWAGIRPGMRVADVGCGSGKTTLCLHKLVEPSGETVGIDISAKRIEYARQHYGSDALTFTCRDIRAPLDDLGTFDFAIVRFVLEYHREQSVAIVRNIARILKPGGILCLIDLDHNCLCHFELSTRLEKTIAGVMAALESKSDFDPYAGRKLYSYLYDLGFQDLDAKIAHDHVIFGELQEKDAFNWLKKVEAARKSGFTFDEYPGGHGEFAAEFMDFFADPRRFTYTPVISCRGRKPED